MHNFPTGFRGHTKRPRLPVFKAKMFCFESLDGKNNLKVRKGKDFKGIAERPLL